jgi:hypothetical protein
MAEEDERRVPWFLWPVYALWRLVSLILVATGRLVCGVLGLVLIAAGAVLSLTVVGAPIGIALGVLGLLLLCRAIF